MAPYIFLSVSSDMQYVNDDDYLQEEIDRLTKLKNR